MKLNKFGNINEKVYIMLNRKNKTLYIKY